MKTRLIALLMCIVSSLGVLAQQSDSSDRKAKWATGIQYISNQTYAGRLDSLRLPVLLPQLNFSIKGFFIHSKAYINLSSGYQGFDGISLEPGYGFSGKHWNGSISLIKYFIKDSSNLIIAPIKSSLEFYISNQNEILNPFAGAECVFTGQGNDLITYGGLSKDIRLTHADKEPAIMLQPTVSLTAGTESFYFSFIKYYAGNGSAGGKKRGRTYSGTTSSQLTQQQSQKFALMGAGIELPVDITKGRMEGKLTPTWEIPLNTLGSTGLKSCMYVTAEVMFDF